MAEPEIKVNGVFPLAMVTVSPGEPVKVEPKASAEEFRNFFALHGLYRTQLEPRIAKSFFPSRTEADIAQEDIPHLIGHRLENFSVCRREARRHSASGREYLEGCFSRLENGAVQSTIVCNPPSRFNSGAHRVILRGDFNGQPFTTIIEEGEGRACQFLGEIVYLGIGHFEEIAENPEAFLQFIVRSAAGVDFYLNSGMRTSDSADIRIFHFLRGDVEAELAREKCALSEAAKGCFLY